MERPDSVAPIERQIGAENGKFYCVRFPGIFSLKWGFESGRGNCLGGGAFGGLGEFSPPVRVHKVKETAERGHTPASFVSSFSSLNYNYTRFLMFAVFSSFFYLFVFLSSLALTKSLFSPTQPTTPHFNSPVSPPHHIRNVFTALSSNRSLTVTTMGLRFLGKIPTLGLSTLKGSDCCEADLFSSRPRATAGGKIINTAGKVKRG